MNKRRLLLCTDMDRTVIPNGEQSEHKKARQRFYDFCSLPEVSLVYVTGRHQNLVEEAIKYYRLPMPDYTITDVGTKIYKVDGDEWSEIEEWARRISQDWNGASYQEIEIILNGFSDLQIQEHEKQNVHKLSYYVSLDVNHKSLLDQISKCLESRGMNASLVWSIDELENIGLLDILPRHATKLHAIKFLQKQLKYALHEVVFAGDSGNDLLVMGSDVAAVLVANASKDVQLEAKKRAIESGNEKKLYIATGKNSDRNGNYSSGVLEGVEYFMPSFQGLFKRL